MSSLEQINMGFLPLLDAAIIIIAQERGFAAAEGLNLRLVREASWATIRDRVAVGQFDAAHMLAPLPIAANLGLNPLQVEMIAPMALGLGGNAITVSRALHEAMKQSGAEDGLSARAAGQALKRVIDARTGNKLRFAVVHPYSGHNYELRYWLAASGVVPDTDVEIVVVPPPLMPDALAAGTIDGFCVGEPWNSVSVQRGDGQIATVKARLWRSSPEKVLGVSAKWAQANSAQLNALMRALHAASVWCGEADNWPKAAAILSEPRFLNVSAELIEATLAGNVAGQTVDDFFLPHARAATFPWVSHALWFYSQMVRWGHVTHSAVHAETARATYRPDLYRRALAPLGVPIPGANAKVEGALQVSQPVGTTRGTLHLGPDGFFDGKVFDPDELDRYIIDQNSGNLPTN